MHDCQTTQSNASPRRRAERSAGKRREETKQQQKIARAMGGMAMGASTADAIDCARGGNRDGDIA